MADKKKAKKPLAKKLLAKKAMKKTKGGAVDAFLNLRGAGGAATGPGDEGPEESITFVFGKL